MTTTTTRSQKPAPNGARAKILRALSMHGMLTIQEIADETHLTAKQVQDNGCQARTAGLLKSGRDDVTQLMAYQITSMGRDWLSANAISVPAPEPDQIAVVKESLTAQEPVEVATTEESSSVAPIEMAKPEPEPEPEPETVITIDAPDDAPETPSEDDSTPEIAVADEYLYAIETPVKGQLKICGTDRQNAIDQALDQTRLTNSLHYVFRLVPVGFAQPIVTVQFVEP